MMNRLIRKCLAATLLTTVAIGPTSALDVSVGGISVGGTNVGVSVGAGTNGASAGISTGIGGTGAAQVGASVGTNGGFSIGAKGSVGGTAVGASVGGSKNGVSAGISAGVGGATVGTSVSTNGGPRVGVSGNIGGTGGGISTGAGSGTVPSSARGAGIGAGIASARSTAGSGSPGRDGGSTIAGIAPAQGVRPSRFLPRILWPIKQRRAEGGRGEWGYSGRFPAPLAAVPGTPGGVLRVCRQAIAAAASPLGAVRVRAASAGRLIAHRRGALTAPLVVRIDYAGQSGIEVRQARVRCRLNASGRVIAVI